MDSKIIFAGRLLELREHSGLSRQEVADNLNISRASLEYYEKGKRRPDFNTIADIARFFNVSIDYLFGLSDVETTDKDVQFICEYTGLKEESVNWLHGMKFAEQEDDEKEIEEKKNIINSMILLDGNISSIGKLSELFYDYCSAIDSTMIQKEKAVIELVTNGMNKTVESSFRLFKDFNEMSDLSLFRMQQTVLNFSMLYCKETLRRLDRVNACINEIEEYLSDKNDYTECDLEEIRKIGEEYGFYPKEE